jgi:hypothetical protein
MIAASKVLSVFGAAGLQDFFRLLRACGHSERDASAICVAAKAEIQGASGALTAMRARWYASLKAGTPDYSVYKEKWYLAEAYVCWSGYSRKYVMMLPTIKDMIGHVESVVDLGAGHGFSSLGLSTVYPKAEIVATNVRGSQQWALAEKIRGRAFSLAESAPNRRVDLLFASEYFEHFHEPIAHLESVLSACNPRVAVIANAFTAKATGHFDSYKTLAGPADGVTTSKKFNQVLREKGYKKAETGFWNNRPAVWIK